MSFGSSISVGRPVTTHTTSASNQRTSTPKVVYPSPRQVSTSPRCCETGRPVMIDSVTGGTICSCQLKSGIPSYLSRVPSLPETMYSAACHQFPSPVGVAADSPTAFYQVGMKGGERAGADSLKMAPSGLHAPYYLEHLMSAHPYNAFYSGFDLNSARRKNATRETTSALKAWLYEHRKNPYPTKGEKIMLAIITRMTLTQVSTWFANARRRLKKESKMDDKDVDLDDIDVDGSGDNSANSRLSESNGDTTAAELSDISDVDEPSQSYPPQSCIPHRLFSPKQRSETTSIDKISDNIISSKVDAQNLGHSPLLSKRSPSRGRNTGSDIIKRETDEKEAKHEPAVVKPKIWSISEIISSHGDEKQHS